MQLTRGQKDALMRKALDIVNKKRAEKRADLVAHWKPSAQAKKVLAVVQDIQNQVDKLRDTFKKAGFTKEYGSWQTTVDGHALNVSIYDLYADDFRDIIKKFESDLMDKCVDEELMKSAKYPDEMVIIDEIELLNISKDFNVDEFLAKYNAL